jgi:hypothetical protein
MTSRLHRRSASPLPVLVLGWSTFGAGACVFHDHAAESVQACTGYAETTCQALYRCEQSPGVQPYASLDDCRYELASNCYQTLQAPDVLASPAGVAACSELMAQVSCPDIWSGSLPLACRAPSGLRRTGAICEVGAQCASARCARSTAADASGFCSEPGESGQRCVAAADCREGLACGAGSVCMAPLPPDTHAPCAEFAEALCARFDTCSVRLIESVYRDRPTCAARVAAGCVQSLEASDGAGTPAGLRSCTGMLPELECGALLGNRWPDACRVAPGIRQDGQPCGQDAQCASTRCMRAAETACGSCASLATQEQACRANGDCSAGLVCAQDGVCRALGISAATCDELHPCAYPLTCASGQCVAAIGQGAQCALSADRCDRYAGLSCGATSSVCEPWPAPAAGQTCASCDVAVAEVCP